LSTAALSLLLTLLHYRCCCLLCVLVWQIQVRDGKFAGLDGLDPVLTWSNSQKSGDVDLSYGIVAAARPTNDIASLPRNVWGRASTDISGWGVSARADVDPQNLKSADLAVDASNASADLSVRMVASAGNQFNVRTVEATKGFDANGARVTVTPRFDLENDDRDVVVNYVVDKTLVRLTASEKSQELTLSQQVDENNRITPTINNKGDLSVEWQRRLSDNSMVTAFLKPNDNLNVEWRDAAWTANVNMPMDGTNISEANVSIKRDVLF
jgi:hypothetical protein